MSDQPTPSPACATCGNLHRYDWCPCRPENYRGVPVVTDPEVPPGDIYLTDQSPEAS